MAIVIYHENVGFKAEGQNGDVRMIFADPDIRQVDILRINAAEVDNIILKLTTAKAQAMGTEIIKPKEYT